MPLRLYRFSEFTFLVSNEDIPIVSCETSEQEIQSMIRTATRMFVIASLTVVVLVSVSTVQALTVTCGTTLMHQDDFE